MDNLDNKAYEIEEVAAQLEDIMAEIEERAANIDLNAADDEPVEAVDLFAEIMPEDIQAENSDVSLPEEEPEEIEEPESEEAEEVEAPAPTYELVQVRTAAMDALRTEAAGEQHFKSSLFGYDKKAVNAYVERMLAGCQAALDEFRAQMEALSAENAMLKAKSDRVDAIVAETRAEEKMLAEAAVSAARKEAAEAMAEEQDRHACEMDNARAEHEADMEAERSRYEGMISDIRVKTADEIGIKEGMLQSMREANRRLTDENHDQKLTIADLESRIENICRRVGDSNRTMTALNTRLSNLIQLKFEECAGMLSSWQEEFGKLTDAVEEEIK